MQRNELTRLLQMAAVLAQQGGEGEAGREAVHLAAIRQHLEQTCEKWHRWNAIQQPPANLNRQQAQQQPGTPPLQGSGSRGQPAESHGQPGRKPDWVVEAEANMARLLKLL